MLSGRTHNTALQPLIRPFGAGGNPSDAFDALVGLPCPAVAPRSRRSSRRTRRRSADGARETHDFHHHLSILGRPPGRCCDRLGLVIDLQIAPDFVPTTSERRSADAAATAGRAGLPLSRRASDDPAADIWNVDVTPATWCRLARRRRPGRLLRGRAIGRADFAHGFLRLDPAALHCRPRSMSTGSPEGPQPGRDPGAHRTSATSGPSRSPPARACRRPAPGGSACVHTGHADDLHEDFYAARVGRRRPRQPTRSILPTSPRRTSSAATGSTSWPAARGARCMQRHVEYRPLRDGRGGSRGGRRGSRPAALTSEVDRPDAPADPDRAAVHARGRWPPGTAGAWPLPRPGYADPAGAGRPGARSRTSTACSSRSHASAVPGHPPASALRRRYRLRVRTVDLAGNAHSLGVADQLPQILEGTGDPRYAVATPPSRWSTAASSRCRRPSSCRGCRVRPGRGRRAARHPEHAGHQSAKEYAEASQGAAERVAALPETARPSSAGGQGLPRSWSRRTASWTRRSTPSGAWSRMRRRRRAQPGTRSRPERAAASRAPLERRFVGDRTQPGEEPPSRATSASMPTPSSSPTCPTRSAVGAKVRLQLDPADRSVVLEARLSAAAAAGTAAAAAADPGRGRDPGRSSTRTGASLTGSAAAPGRTGDRCGISSLFEVGPGESVGIVDWCRQELSVDQDDDGCRCRRAQCALDDDSVARPHPGPRQPAAARARPSLELDTDDVPGFAGAPVLARERGETTAAAAWPVPFSTCRPLRRLDLPPGGTEIVDDPGRRYATSHRDGARSSSGRCFALPVPEPFGTPWQPEIAPLIEPLDDDGGRLPHPRRRWTTPIRRDL